ncbi:MAG: hypothetical protein E7554_03345 [Ruminococcaceae bacterium]|nr:hypothetical protein [Oscillospiraceae bacterium]
MAERNNTRPSPDRQTRGRIDYSKNSRQKRGNQRSDDGGRLSSTIIKLLVVLVLLLLVVSLWRNRIDLSCANLTQCADDTFAMCGTGKGFPSTINGSHAASIDSIADGGIVLLSDTSLTIYDDTAREAAVRAHFMSSPAMKVAGRYAVTFDMGSTDFRVDAAADTIAAGDAERPLVSCAVSRDCCYALVMQGSSKGESWLSSVEVFDREGESLHKWHCADWYLTDAALSADGAYLALAGVNASGGELVSAIIIHKVGSMDQVAEYVLSDNICLSLEYNNDGTLFAIGSNALTVVTDSGKQREDIKYTGTLAAYDVCYDGGAVVCTADELGTTANVYDARGRERCTYRVSSAVQNVSLSDEACAVIGDGILTAIRLDGTLITQVEANATTGGLLLIDRTAYTVDGMRVSSLELK